MPDGRRAARRGRRCLARYVLSLARTDGSPLANTIDDLRINILVGAVIPKASAFGMICGVDATTSVLFALGRPSHSLSATKTAKQLGRARIRSACTHMPIDIRT